jgi:hypothetical protein
MHHKRNLIIFPLLVTGSSKVHHLSDRATRSLWHQCLCHSHYRRLNDLHKHRDGVPNIKLPPDIGEGCDTCITCKGRNANMVNRDTREDATVLEQGILMDFGFMVQSSKTPGRLECLSGHDGETAYLLLTCHKTDMMWGVATKGNKPPVAWLNRWFSQYHPTDVQHRYAAMDKGGELANDPEVMALLDKFDYAPRPTALDAYHQNAPAERLHKIIGNALRTMLTGANIDFKFWPYAFYYMMFLHNFLPHGKNWCHTLGLVSDVLISTGSAHLVVAFMSARLQNETTNWTIMSGVVS